jgi:RsiW-degrading membrane proteinase PrsW (M82 family)
MAHWGFALIAAGAFFGLMMFLFDRGSAKAQSLLFTGVFTGTVGIILLLVLQFVAEHTQGWWIRGRSIIVLLFYIIKFIGYSYYAAEDPSNGFAASFFGYTFGVGLCEELVKAIPLIVLVNNLPERASWRTACLWGLASGVGFGVAEGIMYSSRYYNGIGGGEIYVVRFVSCVALHAMWAASVAIPLYAFRGELANSPHIGSTLGTAICLAAPCIILHGLYDTLLKKDYDLYALGVALVSFAYLVGLIEWSQWKEGRGEAPRRRVVAVA